MNIHKTFFSTLAVVPLLAHSAETKRPNIIYILADDMGYGDVSALDANGKIKTTNLDMMVSEGMHFRDAHTSSSVSTPSRYSILTGRYNWRSELQSGVNWSFSKPLIERDRPTVATMLSQNGYNTAVIGKWHLGLGWAKFGAGENDVTYDQPLSFSPNDNGFDYSFIMSASLDIPPYIYIRNGEFTAPVRDTIKGQEGYGFYREGAIADDFDINTTLERFTQESINYINDKSKEDKPFFLYFPLTAPHTPILPPEEFQGKSGVSPYGDFVLYVDDVVGRIIESVKKAGIEDNTLIIFTTDNGCSPSAKINVLNEHGHYPNSIYRGTKADSYDGGHRIPFIVKWKGNIKEGTYSDTPVSLTSFMATCADILGIDTPKDHAEDSFSIYDDMKGRHEKDERGEQIVIQHSIDGQFAIRKGKWKLITCAYSGGWSSPLRKQVNADMPPMQLFDMSKNPSEKSEENLYDKYPKIVKMLTEELEWAVNNGRTTQGAPLKNNVEVEIYKK